MPNWVYNELTITGDPKQLAKLQRNIGTKKQLVDFNKLTPMPKVLTKVRTGGTTINGKQVKIWLELRGKPVAITPERQKLWKLAYGSDNWYDWSLKNWGTKWNAVRPTAYNKVKDRLELSFETAWSPPVPIILRMLDSCLEYGLDMIYYAEEESGEFAEVFIDTANKLNKLT